MWLYNLSRQIPDLMVTYGKTLMNEMPDETTDFISEVCKDQGVRVCLCVCVLCVCVVHLCVVCV